MVAVTLGHEPEALRDRPHLFKDLYDVAEAFRLLSPSRSINFSSVGFIPLSEITAYLLLFPQADEQGFVIVLQAMDSAYVGVVNGH